MNERIKNDMQTYMKTQDKFSLSVIRMLKSVIQMEAINKKGELNDDEVIMVIKKQVKIRKDSAEEYKKYNKLETVADLEKEIEILTKYLPEEIPDTELEKIIEEVISKIDGPNMKSMGQIMKSVSEIVGSRADMSKVSSLVRQKLN